MNMNMNIMNMNYTMTTNNITMNNSTSNATTTNISSSSSPSYSLPIKLTLLHVPLQDSIKSTFPSAALLKLKSLLPLLTTSSISSVVQRHVDSILSPPPPTSTRNLIEFEYNITNSTDDDDDDVEWIFTNTTHITHTINLYYEITQRTPPNPVEFLTNLRDQHHQLLQRLIEYTPPHYFYTEDFDMCTSPFDHGGWNDAAFVECGYPVESTRFSFRATGLPKEWGEGFRYRLMKFYLALMETMEGVDPTAMVPDGVVEVDRSMDWYFRVGLLRREGGYTVDIAARMEEEGVRARILEWVQNYTEGEGRSMEWCIDVQGRYSAVPCVVVTAIPPEPYVMPLWLLLTISIGGGVLVCGIVVWICIVTCQREREEEEGMKEFGMYMADPEGWRSGRGERRGRKDGRVRSAPPSKRYREEPLRLPPAPRNQDQLRLPQRYREEQLRLSPAPHYRDQLRLPSRHYRDPLQLPPQQEMLQLEGPLYCDDLEVNRRDTPASRRR